MLKPIWQKIFSYNWRFSLLLVLLLGIPRFEIVLQANMTGNYNKVMYIFLLMWLAPFIFLTKMGRKSIGIKKPVNYYWLIYSFIAGLIACTLMYLLAEFLFQNSNSNWFVYISKSYTSGRIINEAEKPIYFLIYTLAGMSFSPIGEELFYRGIVHGGFEESWGSRKASQADSLAFALTHLAHFGIVYINGHWQFLLLPSVLWVVGMFLSSRLFFFCKQKSGSLLGAIICHAGFNLAMMFYIFFYIL
jgi:membrane protease YdiL (CAAX protease family)